MGRRAKALETAEALIIGQEKARARIWGSIEAARARPGTIIGTSNYKQNPELVSLAPYAGETFTVGKFCIKRTQVDQLDNFAVWRAK